MQLIPLGTDRDQDANTRLGRLHGRTLLALGFYELNPVIIVNMCNLKYQ